VCVRVWTFFFFWDRVLWTICPGWLWTLILSVSVSWVARIKNLSHHPWIILALYSLKLTVALYSLKLAILFYFCIILRENKLYYSSSVIRCLTDYCED
jgi:hypothetical protein